MVLEKNTGNAILLRETDLTTICGRGLDTIKLSISGIKNLSVDFTLIKLKRESLNFLEMMTESHCLDFSGGVIGVIGGNRGRPLDYRFTIQ